ncbi:tail fiber domain-containing protein [Salinibacter sp.]|uniref:tail fiber domain-containing protein n=1 Tax=Salinibacter sp. TaxID=2065818 RepID=UPI0021E72CEC|nr:tail fiber domain-containing protein [Salinibacter sp.]
MRTFRRATLLLSFCILLVGTAYGQTPTTTIQNGGADTRLELNYDGGLLVPGTFGPAAPADSIPATGAGARLMWYPAKAAFRAGRVFDIDPNLSPDYRVFWDPPNVGEYSAAFGVNTKASGFASMAAGSRTQATGDYSFALGAPGQIDTEATIASGDVAIAMGSFATASGPYSVAMNRETKATASAATAMGQSTEASAFAATAMGLGTTAATGYSLSLGTYNSANTSDDNTLFVAGNGSSGARSDALVLDQSGNLDISGTLTESSDRRLKTSIRPLEGETLAKLSRLRPVRYRFKNQKTHPAGEQIGLIAQDVRTEFPALVDGEDGDALSLSYSKLTAVLIKGLQEHQSMVDSLKGRVQRLEKQQQDLDHLKKRLARLESGADRSVLAGLTRSSGGLVLAVLFGGLLGAGLLWRRRVSTAD